MENKNQVNAITTQVKQAQIALSQAFNTANIKTFDDAKQMLTAIGKVNEMTALRYARTIFLIDKNMLYSPKYKTFAKYRENEIQEQSKATVENYRTVGQFIVESGEKSIFSKDIILSAEKLKDDKRLKTLDKYNNIDFTYTQLVKIIYNYRQLAKKDLKALSKAEREKIKDKDDYIYNKTIDFIVIDILNGFINYDMTAKELQDLFSGKMIIDETETTETETTETETTETKETETKETETKKKKGLTIEQIFNDIVKFCNENDTTIDAIIKYYNNLQSK